MWRNIIFILVIASGVVLVITNNMNNSPASSNLKSANVNSQNIEATTNTNSGSKVVPAPTNTNAAPPPAVITNNQTSALAPTVVIPIADFFDRITKKPFGIYITPKTSPIQPEKFSGYHTGADAETTSAEKDIDISIHAVADGTVVFAGHVNGYGGVIVIRHQIENQTVTALYGHLRISSFSVKNGDRVKMNTPIAMLGTGFSLETDDERKHLHFGLIKGSTINYKGYVSNKSALSSWDDPGVWLKNKNISN